MSDFVWLREDILLAIHNEQLAEHGGLEGVRDAGSFAAALDRPKNIHAYRPDADVPALAAAYVYGLAKNHPFADGNKRIAFISGELFLTLNGMELTAEDENCLLTVLAVASGDLSEEELEAWFQKYSVLHTVQV